MRHYNLEDGRLLWTKTRELDDDEIVSTIFDSLHRPRWRIRRPTRGWYLILQRIGAETEPYVDLAPVKNRRAGSSNALEFELRLHPSGRAHGGSPTSPARPRSPSFRVDMSADVQPAPASFAMTPSLSAASAASAASSATPLNDSSGSPTAHRRSRSSISSPTKGLTPFSLPGSTATYRLRPSLPNGFGAGEQGGRSFFGRLKSWVVEPPRRFCCVRMAAGGGPEKGFEGDGENVVMAFEEAPSSFLHPRLRGTLSLSPESIDASGFEPSFWVALACAYADVIEERDGYEAAQGGD
ncbi:hypothetical protein DMC30DRAFT_215812 [Rhodotorula diobovata]|uniref:Uncharacterized protein n=1 Tax=Rhodotorula diobovata TaxID=5288 RepID=A0A5C5G4V6_9BASI|nr:hypothetical protein DMC30DRAFT_215812 [Rhodotorula diobovata]